MKKKKNKKKEFGLEVLFEKLLDIIMKRGSKLGGEVKLCLSLMKKNKKMILVAIRWKLKPRERFKNRIRKKKEKISYFGKPFKENSQEIFYLETYYNTKIRTQKIAILFRETNLFKFHTQEITRKNSQARSQQKDSDCKKLLHCFDDVNEKLVKDQYINPAKAVTGSKVIALCYRKNKIIIQSSEVIKEKS
jgi:hypothetical protein